MTEYGLELPLLLHDRRGVSPVGRKLQTHVLLVVWQIERMQGDFGDHASGLRGHVRLDVQHRRYDRPASGPVRGFPAQASRHFS